MVVLLMLIGLALVLVLAVGLADWLWGPKGACGFALLGSIAAFLLFVPFAFFILAGTLILSVGCWFFERPRGAATISATVAALFVLFTTGGIITSRAAQIAEIAEKAPLVSLDERLAYEAKARPAESAPQLAAAVEGRLANTETWEGGWGLPEESRRDAQWREMQLARVHAGTESEFVRAMGFGVERLNPLSRPFVELPPQQSIPLPPDDTGTPSIRPPDAPAPPQRPSSPPDSDVLATLHNVGQHDFLGRERTGFVREHRQVAGFQPHQFGRMPLLPRERWQVTRLELVNMLKHAQPVVYISRNLPNLGELATAATRPLTDFETRALARLRSEEDIVIEEGAGQIQMLGSLRASKTCLQCHEVQRGELLGALSYVLKPKNREARPMPKPNDSAFSVR